MYLQIINSTEELSTYLSEWKALVREAAEPNVFFEPGFLLPALKYFGTDNVFCVLIWAETDKKRTLIGLFPLMQDFGYKYLPLRYIALWKHSQCFLTTPLVHRDFCKECLQAFFLWLGNSSKGSSLLTLDGFNGAGVFCNELRNLMLTDGTVYQEMEAYKRSFLNCNLSNEQYLNTAFKEKSLNRLQKKRKTLEKEGELTFTTSRDDNDITGWMEDFLELEKSGWKGREGTALACNPAEEAFFRESIQSFFEDGQLLMTKLNLDERIAAMQCLLISRECAFVFKIAYNEALGKYSPGTILDLELVEYVLDKTNIQWIDSCTLPGSSLDRVFKDERVIRSWVISSQQLGSRSIVSAIPYLKKASALVKSMRPMSRA